MSVIGHLGVWGVVVCAVEVSGGEGVPVMGFWGVVLCVVEGSGGVPGAVGGWVLKGLCGAGMGALAGDGDSDGAFPVVV